MKSYSIALLLIPGLSIATFANSRGFSIAQNPVGFISQDHATATVGNGACVPDLDQYWNLLVGPVQTAAIHTTVPATPVPTSELNPPPPLYYPPFPTGHQAAPVVKNNSWKFPSDFAWGVASAAYQVEGAAKAEGRGPSIWDVMTHRTPFAVPNETGDIADNHYYLYKQDIARIAALGVPYYSFSISWSRVFPFGRGPKNEQALRHYDDVIETCRKYNVTPVVTLYHFDHPLFLQNKYGGWLSEEIVGDFLVYAEVIFERYRNKVAHWYTINEPNIYCDFYPYPKGYFTEVQIPDSHQKFFCGHNSILAHAMAYRLGKSLGLNGTISYKNAGGWKMPLKNQPSDINATQRAWDFSEGWFANPVYVNGDYPQSVKEYVSTFGLNFTDEQKELIKGTADNFSEDAYIFAFYSAPDVGIDNCLAESSHPLYPYCFDISYTGPTGWLVGASSDPSTPWIQSATEWVPALLRYIQETWKPSGGIVVAEFGFTEPYEHLKTQKADILMDPLRSMYYRKFMEAILIAISEGVKVVGCFSWSLMDNLEWQLGYRPKFGLQYVNFTTLERSYKASFFEYINAFKVYAEDPVVPVFVPGIET